MPRSKWMSWVPHANPLLSTKRFSSTTKPRGIHPSQISKWLKCKQRTHKTFTLLNYFTQFFWAQNNNKGKVLLTGIFASSDLKLILSGCCGVMN